MTLVRTSDWLMDALRVVGEFEIRILSICKETKNLLDHILFKVNMSSIHKRNS